MTRGRIKFVAAATSLAAVVLLIILIPGKAILGAVPFSRIITDRNGEPLRIFLTEDDKYRIYRHVSDFPPTFVEAVMLQEDRHFYGHPGVNPAALVRAAWETYIRRERRVGGSTITMQLARLRYGFQTRHIPGKIRQIFTAFRLELFHSKQDILESYLNLVPCGKNLEGYPAAALYYFGKDISRLTLSEQLLLAVIPQDPRARAPQPNSLSSELLTARGRLAESWLIQHPNDAGVTELAAMPVSVQNGFPFTAPHLTEYLNLITPVTLEPVKSTLDSELQRLADLSLADYLERHRSYGVKNGAILIADYRRMEVLALVGSADYFNDEIQGQVNGATAKRSPGSTLKPFIYALAVDAGLITPDTVLKDTPGSFSEYTPDNYRGDFKGAVPAWKALVDSRNIPAITLESRLKDDGLYGLLKSGAVRGLKERGHYGLSIVLGSAEVTMLELTALYAALANGGIHRPWNLVVPGSGESAPDTVRLMSPEAAWLTLDMLKENPPPFEFRPKEVEGIPVAFKTGTSIGFKDAWCVAVAGPYVVCVWIGNFNGLGNNAFLGRAMATPLLFEITDNLLSRRERNLRYWRGFPPGNLRKVSICSVSGQLAGDYCPTTTQGWFIPGVSPIGRCNVHRRVYVDTATGYRTDRRGGPGIEAQVREFWTSDMLELFEEAGLPRLVPPPYAPESRRTGAHLGFPPEIIHPLAASDYIIDPTNPRYASIPLNASVDSDVTELFWFADSSFVGRCAPGEVVKWTPDPGSYTVTVAEDSGRSASVNITVKSRLSLEP